MLIIDNNTIKNKKSLPYFYLKEFALFEKREVNKEVVYFSDEFGNTIACKVWKNKFLKVAQLLYPPLSSTGQRLDVEGEQLFLDKWVCFIRKQKLAHRIAQPENFAIFKCVPKNSVSVNFGTYFINLSDFTAEELFKNLHVKHRNVVKNAQKHGVVLKYGEAYLNDFYTLYQQTMQRSNMYCQDITYFQNFQSQLGEFVLIGVAYVNDVPQGALFIPFTKFGAFYLYGASAEKIEINGAINYLHWNTVMKLKGAEVKRYDFVGARLSDVSGTKLEGIQQFKKRFGAELERGFLWKIDVNKLYCCLFDGLVAFKLKLLKIQIPLDIIDQERRE
jgi:hypothetical protein